MTVLRSGSATDTGMLRTVNQDSVLEEITSFAVCDGMGGHAGGEVASSTAVASLRASLGTTTTAEGLMEAVRTANQAVLEAGADDPKLAGMGTTAVVALLAATPAGDRLLLANVGDSRGYLFHEGELRQITDDHSMVAEMVRAGQLSAEEAHSHPQRHVITRVLGTSPQVDVDLFELNPVAGDRILLCSDGLINELDEEEVTRVLATVPEPTAAAADLVRRANAHGGADNISVVVIDALVAEETDEEHAPTVRAVPPGLAKGDESWLARRRRLGAPRAITVRTVAFVLLLVGLVVGTIAFVRWYAASQYYVQSNGNAIVIYQGHPGGTLWISPKKVQTTTATLDQVLSSRRAELAAGVPEPSLQAAKSFVANLTEEYRSSGLVSSGSTTTTTTTTPTG